MRNRAKCKLCNQTIESLYPTDIQICECSEISVTGLLGRCGAKNWDNFIRIDEEGNEIVPKIVEKGNEQEISISPNCNTSDVQKKPTKKEMVEMLESMLKNIEQLPRQAMMTSINHYDFSSLILILCGIFQSEEK